MLCELAHSFPQQVAKLLDRDRNLTRNFREESVTDLLMASMIGLEGFGVRVDFPYEPTTGGDMDWIYAAPLEVNGGRYLRLILQAKRAQYVKLKTDGYWYYQHLDHGRPKGQQAQTLVNYASSSPDHMATLPLYVFYHPQEALSPASAGQPAVEGVNIVFASDIAQVVAGGCSRPEKAVKHWRSRFMPLSDLLCWPTIVADPRDPKRPNVTQFIVGPMTTALPDITGGFHPDLVAERLNGRRQSRTSPRGAPVDEPAILSRDTIPEHIRRAIEGQVTEDDRKQLKRPRAILSTRLTRASPDFVRAAELSRRRG